MKYDIKPDGGRVLIIDDVPSVSGRINRWMIQEGYECIFVRSHNEADAFLKHEHLDAVAYSHEFFFPPN